MSVTSTNDYRLEAFDEFVLQWMKTADGVLFLRQHQARREELEAARKPSTTGRPLGMPVAPNGTLRHAASVPMTLWNAHTALFPGLHTRERKDRILARLPLLKF